MEVNCFAHSIKNLESSNWTCCSVVYTETKVGPSFYKGNEFKNCSTLKNKIAAAENECRKTMEIDNKIIKSSSNIMTLLTVVAGASVVYEGAKAIIKSGNTTSGGTSYSDHSPAISGINWDEVEISCTKTSQMQAGDEDCKAKCKLSPYSSYKFTRYGDEYSGSMGIGWANRKTIKELLEYAGETENFICR
jgi:hypothetical protein